MHKSWWAALLYVCEEELREAEFNRQDDKARLKRDMSKERWTGRDDGVHSSVDSGVADLLAGTYFHLQLSNEGQLHVYD